MGVRVSPEFRATRTGLHWHLAARAAPIRAVLFDFDGTLVDSEYLHHEAWLEAVAPWGVTLGWHAYQRQLVGLSDRRACEFFMALAGLEPTPARLETGRGRKHRAYRRRAVRELALEPWVREWLRARHRSVPLGVVSSSAIPDVVPILERQGVASTLRFVICGDHVERLKPDPMPYLLAFEKLREGMPDLRTRECLVFEDSATGVRSASDAGMTVQRLAVPSDLPASLQRWSPKIRQAAVREPDYEFA